MARGFLISEGLHRDIKQTIARVDGMPDGPGATKIPTRFESLPTQAGKVFRVCTFTGAWSIGDAKTVTFKYQTATPNTASVTNLFFPVTSTATAATDCGIAKDGTAWFLIDVPFETATAVFVGSIATGIHVASTATATVLSGVTTGSVLTDVTLSASLNTSNCTISIGKTLVTASRTFVSGTSTATVIGSTATSVFVQSTFTSTFLRFKV
jgi:hypothetical protein